MNWQHLQAIVWLRWRLMANQWRRAGTLNAVLLTVFTAILIIAVVPLFFGSLVGGIFVVPKLQPAHLMYTLDGLVIGFLFFWMIGLITELQRTEPLSLLKFLHLPISVNGAFLINYLASLVRVALVLFLPIWLGICLAIVWVKGPLSLLALPALAAFVLMVTAVTYQFQGWLASMMTNPRRRRTVVVGVTMGFVLLSQTPNLLNLMGFWKSNQTKNQLVAQTQEMTDLQQKLERGEITLEEHQRRFDELQQNQKQARQIADRESLVRVETIVLLANRILPIGWFPQGVMATAEGNPWPSVWGSLGMTLIGALSLRRAYRTTVRMYVGGFSNAQPTSTTPAAAQASATQDSTAQASTGPRPKAGLLEWRIPRVSEPVSAVALATLQGILRSPEAKMMLLTMIVMCGVTGGALMQISKQIPELARPLVAFGALFFVMFGIMQLMSNQFGFDREGYRVYVLSAARRRDILLGKNLAFAAITLLLAVFLLTIVQVFVRLRIDHLVAIVPNYISLFLLDCLLANVCSIYAPLYIAPGTFKPANPKFKTIALQMVIFMVFIPLVPIPTLIPLGVEALARYLEWPAYLPIFLVLSLVECALIIWLYGRLLDWQGDLLQQREQKILEVVTNK
ncbi:MAG: ABC transporter permease [Planctomycetes bacterium]|nr:ABC transporter permease [Planctomycetota bacterium]